MNVLGREAAILQAVGVAAERFLEAADWRSATDVVLRSIGAATGASRAHIYAVRPGEGNDEEVYCSLLYEWTAEDVAPVIDDPREQDFPMRTGGYERWVEVLGEGKLLAGVRDEFPDSERAFLESEGILSVLVLPIFVEGRWWGWMGFDDTHSERMWTQPEIDALRSAVGALGAAVHRERMEQQRLNAEAKYRTLVEQLPSITYIASADAENAILYMSPQVQGLTGYPPADFMKTRGLWERLVLAEDHDEVYATLATHNGTGEPYAMEYRMRSRWGRELWVHEEASLVRGEDGEPMYWQGVILDITERKRAEEDALEAEARYRALVETVPAIVYIDSIEDRGETRYMSPQVERILGWTSEEWMADDDLWEKRLHPDDHDRVMEENERAESTFEPFSLQYRMIARDGREVWINDQCVVVRDESGRPIYWHGVLIDITDRMRALQLEGALEEERDLTQQLRDLDEMKNTFLAALSHDFRTPLAVVLGLSLTIARKDLGLPEPEIRDMAARIAGQARKLDRLVTDLLDLERLSKTGADLERMPTEILPLVERVVAEADLPSAGPVHVQIEPLTANVDPLKLERIVENLLYNAVRHSDGAEVWIRASREPRGLVVSVEDSGPGVPDGAKERIFEAFRRGEGVRAPGAGVGLSLVARFAEMHGGRAWVEDRPGGGASFRVLLPES